MSARILIGPGPGSDPVGCSCLWRNLAPARSHKQLGGGSTNNHSSFAIV